MLNLIKDMRGLWSALQILLCLATFTFHSVLTAGNGQQCRSTFHVWKPGEDAQRMFRELYLKMDNVTSFSKLQVADLRAHLSIEVNRINNWTFALDKRIMEMQVKGVDGEMAQMKHDQGVSRMQREIDHTVRRVDDLESSIYNIRGKLRDRQWGTGNGLQQDGNNHPGRRAKTEDLNLMLQDSIGDLKAEWLLLKRDVEGLKKEEKRQRKHLQVLKDEGVSLKMSLEKATSTNKEIQTSSSEMRKSQTTIQERMDALSKDTLHVQHLMDDFKKYLQDQRGKLASIQTLSQSLESRLDEMAKQEAQDATAAAEGKAVESLVRDAKGPEESTEGFATKNNFGLDLPKDTMKDCQDIYRAGFRASGVFHIQPDGVKYALPVYCLIINGTGYTIIQRRLDGTINFNRRWIEYRQGFGNPYGEIWMGTEFMHHITKQKRYILRVDMWDWEGDQFYAEYKKFWVDGEEDHYRLNVGDYIGNSGDSLSYHDQMAFSTEDVDNDLHQRHCGAENKGGWWYNSCFLSQLNGLYHTGWYAQTQSNFADGTVWYTLKNSEFYSLRKVEMSIKPLEL